jgi:predicted transcriptional regulator with HTH domain
MSNIDSATGTSSATVETSTTPVTTGTTKSCVFHFISLLLLINVNHVNGFSTSSSTSTSNSNSPLLSVTTTAGSATNTNTNNNACRKEHDRRRRKHVQQITKTFLYLEEDESESSGNGRGASSVRVQVPKLQKSAFGSAAIGQKKQLIEQQQQQLLKNKNRNEKKVHDEDEYVKSSNEATVASTSTLTSTSKTSIATTRRKRKTSQKVSRKPNNINNNGEEDDDQIENQKNAALDALKTHLQLPHNKSLEILNSYPSLYTPSSTQPNPNFLSSKLLYLLNDINIKPKTLKRMFTTHPKLMENVLLESEDNLTNTVEVLQTELDLSLEDIQMIQSNSLPAILSYPRSELRKRILVYKLDLLYPTKEMKRMVWKDPRMLRTDSTNVRQILNVFREELDIDKYDVHQMLGKEILLLTYNAESNIRPTIRYLKEHEVGKCLGMVIRKGKSTTHAASEEESENIIKERLKALVMGHPKVLSSSIEKKLKPIVSFFLNDCGLSEYEFGRVIYRRGGSLLEANVDRTLKWKVAFLRENLGLDVDDNGDDGVDTDLDRNFQVEIPSLDAPSSSLSTFERKRLLAQMIATNPDILTLSIENNLQPKFDYFYNTIGFTKEELRYVLLKRPQLLALSLERNIIPKIEYFIKPRKVTNINTRTSVNGANDETEVEGEGGLGMNMNQVRSWLAQYPQTLAVVLSSRIKPRIKDVVHMGLFIGDGVLPLNFLTRTERNWKQWKDEYIEECGLDPVSSSSSSSTGRKC